MGKYSGFRTSLTVYKSPRLNTANVYCETYQPYREQEQKITKKLKMRRNQGAERLDLTSSVATALCLHIISIVHSITSADLLAVGIGRFPQIRRFP